MNGRLVLRLLGMVSGVLCLAWLACLLVAAMQRHQGLEGNAAQVFGACAAGAAVVAALLLWLTRKAEMRIFRREALAIVGLSWLFVSVLGAIPYWLLAPELGWAGGIFESTSGMTTTGASVVSAFDAMPRSLLFWRALSQWIGGLGVVVLFVALLGSLGAGAKVLFANESTAPTVDFRESRIQQAVLNLATIYGGLSLACLLALRLGGLSWYDAVCHMFTTVATGGFSTYGASYAAFESAYVEWVGIVFMILGGTSFIVLGLVFRGNPAALWKNTEVRFYLLLLVGATAAIAAHLSLEGWESGIHDPIRAAAFQVVSIATTAGFATRDFGGWSTFPQILLFLLMIVGGCSASTSGGTKVFRFILALKVAWIGIEKALRPRITRPLRLNNRTLDSQSIHDALVYLTLLGTLTLLFIPFLAFMEPDLSPLGAITAVVACLFNIGPGLAEVGPAAHFGHFSNATKLKLSVLMIMGRVELYAVLVLFTATVWRRFR